MTDVAPVTPEDSSAARKERGAFFTPDEITRYIVQWAVRSAGDLVLEPSAGDAAFLVSAVAHLKKLGSAQSLPTVYGVEIHGPSAAVACQRVADAGGKAIIREGDFFKVLPEPRYDAVVGNPPFIRYQQFSGESRKLSREAAFRAGVPLSAMASSWAAFTVHAAMFLKEGGRLGLVLPAELLAVNYAAPIRRFLFTSFRDVQLVLFEQQVFPDAEAEVVLVLADGYGEGPAAHAIFKQAKNASDLMSLGEGAPWVPVDPSEKWTSSLVDAAVLDSLDCAVGKGTFCPLEAWGDTTLGIVTGNNKYFTLSPERARVLGLRNGEVLRLSPPGSSHLRGLALTQPMLKKLGDVGQSTLLFYPGDSPSAEAAAYIEDGFRTGVHTAYKCRIRKAWYRVPLVRPADLLLTCMNADTARLTANLAGAHHLNSVHGVYLNDEHRDVGRELLPLASLNSLTLLHAELVGRSYGGGILKIEPREADAWLVPSLTLVRRQAVILQSVKAKVSRLLSRNKLLDAVSVVDEALLLTDGCISTQQLEGVRRARSELANRRRLRGVRGH